MPTWMACTSACCIMTFFLQFFPDLVKNGHVYILETPLFRVRNKQKTIYCYSDEERQRAIARAGQQAGDHALQRIG